jgi:hypothetical protein
MSVTTSGADTVHGAHVSSLLFRCTPTMPTMLGGLVAIIAIVARMSTGHEIGEIYALALVTSTAGIGFALDDPAAETVAPSPTTLGRRRLIRIAVAGAIAVTAWGMIATAVATSKTQHFPAYDLGIELAALGAIGLATSALVHRRTGSPGGPTAALVVLVGPAFMYGVVFRDVRFFPSLVPGQDLRERWVWLALLAGGSLLITSRDPATRSSRFRAKFHDSSS